MTDPGRALMLSWIAAITRGASSDALVTIPVSELIGLEEHLRSLPDPEPPIKAKVNHRKPKGLTSRSKLRRRPNSDRLAFTRRHVCCSCYDPRCSPVEAHHAGRKRDKGFGRKPPDERAIPLGLPCHHHFHATGHFPGLTVEQTQERVEKTITELEAEWQGLQAKEAF